MHDPLSPHRHDPNPNPPSASSTFYLHLPDGSERAVTVADLRGMPAATVPDCYIVSTGHGTSGPFRFGGVLLLDLLSAYMAPDQIWAQVEVISEDGFGARLYKEELGQSGRTGQILLAYDIDGAPMTRQQGLVRLIVPGETDDALKQVKWVGRMRVAG